MKIKEEPISQRRAAASARDASHGQSQSRAAASARDASHGQNGKRTVTSTHATLENLGGNQPRGSMQNTDVNSNTITNGKTDAESASNSALPTAAAVGRTKRYFQLFRPKFDFSTSFFFEKKIIYCSSLCHIKVKSFLAGC